MTQLVVALAAWATQRSEPYFSSPPIMVAIGWHCTAVARPPIGWRCAVDSTSRMRLDNMMLLLLLNDAMWLDNITLLLLLNDAMQLPI